MNDSPGEKPVTTNSGPGAALQEGTCPPQRPAGPAAVLTADDASFSFRWGIPLPDGGYTSVPNFFFDHYAEAGVTRTEFLAILHLARYQYETPGSECRPSVKTVARQMGYTVRALQKILAKLEARGLLQRHYRPGYTTIYDFSGFSKAVLAAKLSTGVNPSSPPNKLRDEPEFIPGDEPQFTRRRKNRKTAHKKGGDGHLTEGQRRSFDLLVDFGVRSVEALEAARKYDPADVRGWLDYAKSARGLRDPPGFVLSRLRNAKPPPPKHICDRRDDWRNDSKARERKYASLPEIKR
jgi:hypothetical protein